MPPRKLRVPQGRNVVHRSGRSKTQTRERSLNESPDQQREASYTTRKSVQVFDLALQQPANRKGDLSA